MKIGWIDCQPIQAVSGRFVIVRVKPIRSRAKGDGIGFDERRGRRLLFQAIVENRQAGEPGTDAAALLGDRQHLRTSGRHGHIIDIVRPTRLPLAEVQHQLFAEIRQTQAPDPEAVVGGRIKHAAAPGLAGRISLCGCQRAAVAQRTILLYRRVELGELLAEADAVGMIRRPAEYNSAIQQIENLRDGR